MSGLGLQLEAVAAERSIGWKHDVTTTRSFHGVVLAILDNLIHQVSMGFILTINISVSLHSDELKVLSH